MSPRRHHLMISPIRSARSKSGRQRDESPEQEQMYERAGAHVSRVKTGHLTPDHAPGDRRPGHHLGGRGNDVIAKGGSAMKVVVIGGTGLIGSKLVEKLRKAGHDALAASPDTGVDILTGEGLDEALDGAEVVVDVSNAPAWDDAAVMDFFLTSSRNILTAETAAGISHHVALSVVGTDRLPESGYFRAKLAQEEAIKAAAVPYTIVRATQFFEFLGRIADSNTNGETVRIPPVLVQPEAAEDVAAALAVAAAGAPVNGTVELAGPETFRLDELTRRVLSASGDARKVTADGSARYFGAELDDRSLIPGEDARIAPTRFEDWLDKSAFAHEAQRGQTGKGSA